MTNSLSRLTDQLLRAARKAGADEADSIAVSGSSVSIDVRGGKLEHAERSEGTEIGLRVLIGKQQACVSASDIRDNTITMMAERAVAMAREAPQDDTIGLADADQLARDVDAAPLELTDPADDPEPGDLQSDATAAEAAALAVRGVSQVQVSSAGFGRHAVHLAATNGFSGGYERSSRSTSCVAITGSGTNMERDYFAETRVIQSDLPDAGEIGRLAGARAAARAGARKPPTGTYPVLFDERVAGSLIGHLTAAINGSSIVRGASWARDLMDKPVLPAGMDLIEDPHRARISGSKPFDGEGLPTGARKIVESGVLRTWTLDLATARKLGLASTANATRGPSAPPAPSVGNLWLSHGAASRDDLLADMGTGLLVTSMIGSTINPNTGDYSRGASGFWVENGQIGYPVNECTLAGNLIDMLARIIPANDGRTHLSRVVPSILIDDMVLAGS